MRFSFLPLLTAVLAAGAVGGCGHEQAPSVKVVEVVPQRSVETKVLPPPVSPGPHMVRKLAASPGHTCALLVSGKVACWGGGLGPIDKRGYHTNLKHPTLVKGIEDAVDISTGNYHACAARASGKVVCWGSNSDGELGDPERHIWREHNTLVNVQNATDVVALAGRATHTCALQRNGHVQCWGKNAEGQLGSRAGQEVVGAIEVPGVEDVVELSVSHAESCARHANGKVMCWGGPTFQGMNNNITPHEIEGINDAVGLASDGSQACITRANGSLVCVAILNNSKREIKLPDPKDRVTGAAGVGAGFVCAVTASGKVACLGSNHSGELGDGTTESREDVTRYVVDLDDATQVVASWNNLCALRRSGDVACWGANNEAQLGIGSDDIEPPFPVPNVTAASKVVVGPEASCSLVNETVKCWGHDFTRSQYASRSEPSAVPGLDRGIVDIALGRWHGCALKKTGAVVCWGNPSTLGAQLPYRDDASVKPIANITDAVAITTGENHTCARRKSGRVACWGQNQKGELGNGSTHPSLAAVDVTGLIDAAEVSAGANHTCARRTNGSVMCWGANDSGQLGAFGPSGDPTPPSNVPIAVAGLKPATAIGAGVSHTCVLAADGKVTCWGHQHHGRVICSHPGGCKGQRFIEVPDLSAKTLTVGGGVSCAVDSTKVAKCWSRVTEGDTDLKSIASLPGPVDALAVESSHSCALVPIPKSASTPNVLCWGRNEAGQVGAPPPYRTKPVAVIWDPPGS